MNIIIFLPLVSAVFVFGLGIFVYFREPKSKLNIIFSLICLSVCVWLFGTFMMFLSKDNHSQAIFWDRFIYMGVVFVPALFYHFSLKFRQKENKILLIISYILSLAFLVISRTDYFVNDIFEYSWGVHTQAKFFHHIFLVFFSIFSLLVLINFYRAYKEFRGVHKEQARYLLLAFFILIGVGSAAYLPAYKISIYPFSFTSGVIFTIITAYTIIKYRLMNIRMVLGKTTVYFLSFILIIGLNFLLVFLNNKLAQPFSFYPFFSFAIIFTVLISRPVFRFFEKIASKYFYYTFYSSQKVLTGLGKKLIAFLEVNRLSSLIIDTLVDTLKMDRAAVFLKNPEAKMYKLQKNIGFDEHEVTLFARNSFLRNHLTKTKRMFSFEEIPLLIREDIDKKKDFISLQNDMKMFEINLCFPLFQKDEMIGMIILGRKVSGDSYTKEDIELLITLFTQSSIAFQNALLYSEVQDLSQNLQEKVKEQTRDLRQAYEELKRLDQAKSEFISMASHQLRTPLTSVKGYISMLMEGDYGKMEGKQKKILNNVFLSNERLIRIVNELLNISRIELGRMEMHKEKTQIGDLVKSCHEEMKQRIKENGLTSSLNISTPLPKITVDGLKIRQAILNLLDNAIHYTRKGGIEINVSKKGSKIVVSIKDTGEGMTEEEIKNVFSGFTRGRAGINMFVEGAGLGLHVAKKYMDLHNGKIWAESEGRKKGATFYIELPIK